MSARLNYSGLLVAGLGFFLTRFTVTLAIYEDPLRFYLAGVVPLALGLGLAAFGVALAVVDVEASVARTTATWCVVGTGAMGVLVGLTLLGSPTGEMSGLASLRPQSALWNFLIGGGVGGSLTGLYASRNRRQRGELVQQANRLEVLNRLLRHEVLNAVTVIRGYATLDSEDRLGTASVIERRSDTIQETIEEVTYLTRSAGTSPPSSTLDLEACLTASVETVRRNHPDATVSVGSVPAGLTVCATDHLEQVFTQLLENAVVHAEKPAPEVAVSVSTTASGASVHVRDEGPGLPERQRALLETGKIGDFDDPSAGFGLNLVRFLLENVGGSATVERHDDGTTITVSLHRSDVEATGLESLGSDAGVRPAIPHLIVTLLSGLGAGVVYGAASTSLGGSVAAIGVFYGIQDAVVGWLTHEFHSVVFAFVFAGIVSRLPARYRNHVPAYAAVGTAWGLFLWAVAAGVVAPVWLRLLGVPAPIPNLSLALLVSHVVWGCSLGATTALGYRHLSPWLTGVVTRLRRGTSVASASLGR